MRNLIVNQNTIILIISTIIYVAITILIQNKILSTIFKIEKKKFRKIWFIQVAIISILKIIFPFSVSKILEIICQVIIYKKYLSFNVEKALIAEEINVTIKAVTELISIKTIGEIYNIGRIKEASENLAFTITLLITMILLKIIIYIVINKTKIKLEMPENLENKAKKQVIQISIISSLLILIDEIEVLNCIETLPNSAYLFDIILVLSYYFISTIGIIKIIQINKDKNQIDDLKGSQERLQDSYDSICSFRHDFRNIMQSFGGYIATKDINGLQKMYNDVIEECQEMNNQNNIDKEKINNPAVYQLINSKYLLAKKESVKIKLEVYIDINKLKIKTYELCRILGILIDNAIEAAKECDDKVISIKFIKDKYNNRDLIVIENTCKNQLIDLSKLKEKGFSTKKNKIFHGLGLWKVNQIIKKNENLRLYTSRDKIFKQQLEIYNWN